MSKFEPGHTAKGGRPQGSRNKLVSKFVDDLFREWEANGAAVLRILRIEDPAAFAKLVSALVPKEVLLEQGPLASMSDDELTEHLALIRKLRQNAAAAIEQAIQQPSKGSLKLMGTLALAPDKLSEIEQQLQHEQERRVNENKLAHYKPYPKQLQFHHAGATHRERLLMAGNQLGKTLAGGFELAMHATGRYPQWWKGKRFDKPIVAWAAGTTGETTRDTVQRVLIGRVGQPGTGAIPKDALGTLVPARGVADLLDTIRVKHETGGWSTIGLKSYLSGREKFQGETLQCLWFDEEPPADVYSEGLTRTNIGSNPVFMTFTPLLGVSEVVRRFLLEQSPDRHKTTMTIDDVEHYSAEERKRIIASYPAHEAEARVRGVPTLGSGRIFPVPEEAITCKQRDFPSHWPRLGGMDFGWDHPFAAVEIIWDRDQDCVYVSRAYRARETTPINHAAALRPWGKDLRWAWPRDGRRETLEGAGIPLAAQYSEQGLEMLHEHSQFQDGSVSVEAGLMDMLGRMQSGRFKVFEHLNDWFEEFRLYHRKDGKVVKEGDDLMAATRYAVMMLRWSRTASAAASFRRKIEYQNLAAV